MKGLFVTLDNKHIMLINEIMPIPGLEDGTIYMLSDKTGASEQTLVSEAMRKLEMSECIYQYNVQLLDSTVITEHSDNFTKAIEDGYYLVLPLNTPDSLNKQYLLARAADGKWAYVLPALISTADNLTRQAVMNAMGNLALQEPESCRRLIEHLIDSWQPTLKTEEPQNKSLLNIITSGFIHSISRMFFGPGLAMASVNSTAVSKQLREESYKQSLEIMNRFVDNFKTIERLKSKLKFTPKQEALLEKAQSEVNYVYSMITPQIFSDFAIQMSRKRDVTLAYDNYINRGKLAEKSRLTVSVELPRPEIDAMIDPKVIKKIKTNGKYRVYLTDGEKTVQVRFGRRASCIIYIIYLIDRKHRGENIDTIRISHNRETFCALYSLIYSESGASKAFRSLVTQTQDEGVKRARLADCYIDIRDALTSAVSSFKESPLPFYIPNEKSHITVLAERIVLPESIASMNVVGKNEETYGS